MDGVPLEIAKEGMRLAAKLPVLTKFVVRRDYTEKIIEMKMKNLSSYTTEEIKAQLEEKQGLLKRMKFDHAISLIENPIKN